MARHSRYRERWRSCSGAIWRAEGLPLFTRGLFRYCVLCVFVRLWSLDSLRGFAEQASSWPSGLGRLTQACKARQRVTLRRSWGLCCHWWTWVSYKTGVRREICLQILLKSIIIMWMVCFFSLLPSVSANFNLFNQASQQPNCGSLNLKSSPKAIITQPGPFPCQCLCFYWSDSIILTLNCHWESAWYEDQQQSCWIMLGFTESSSEMYQKIRNNRKGPAKMQKFWKW